MCHYNRPEYTRRSLEALSKCEGIREYVVCLFQDGQRGLPTREMREVKRLLDAIYRDGPTNGVAWWGPAVEHRGVNRATKAVLDEGFIANSADFVIHVEDDVLLAPDALRFFEHCAETYKDDPEVFSITAYNRQRERPPEDRWHCVERRSWYHGWGWGTWRNRYDEFKDELVAGGGETWDVHLHKRVMHRPGPRVEVHPTLSRSQNIGVKSSLHRFTPEWHAENQHVPHYAADFAIPDGAWTECTAPSS